MQLHLSTQPSPLGELLLATDGTGILYALDFADHRSRLQRLLRQHHGSVELTSGPVPPAIAQALDRYFQGDPAALDTLEVASIGNDLEKGVWQALRRIPAGTTTSYGALARQLGFNDPRAAIDIGAANGANPILIVVPCHRVVARNGDLKGYAGGLERKARLLELEGAQFNPAKVRPQDTDRLHPNIDLQ
jgi:methylated-DNA-[protein]-cysteine S-methyltransferase